MKSKYIFNILSFGAILLCIIVLMSCININIVSADEIRQETVLGSQKENFSNELNGEYILSNVNNTDGTILIEGANRENFSTKQPLTAFEEIKLIPNANYFLINPKHYDSAVANNKLGACTTIAMQMLLGYHNYYSHRRILPSSFVASGMYGDINYSPSFYREREDEQGCPYIGTKDDLYNAITSKNSIADAPGVGQAIPLVVDATLAVINENSPDDVKNKISIAWGVFSAEQARADIDAGLPIVLGMDLLLEGNMHVVPAYGYAKYGDVDGFLVHYGWGDVATMVWVPESFFGFQIRMSVDHTHYFVDTGNIVKYYGRELVCSECGCNKVDALYETEGSSITGVRYPLSGRVDIPSTISYYKEDEAIFNDTTIDSIGDYTFLRQTQITSVVLPSELINIGYRAFSECTSLAVILDGIPTSVTAIGERAFEGCSSLTDIYIFSGVSTIGNAVFRGCNNLNITVSSENMNFSAQGNILYDKNQNTIIATGKVDGEVIIPNSVTVISPSAFEENTNIEVIKFYNSPSIGDYAFKNCSNLNSVCFYTDLAPTLGSSVFYNTDAIVYVPYDYISQFSTSFDEETVSVTSKECVVDFVCNGVEINTITIHYGETINNLPSPILVGYVFEGWYDNQLCQGESYQNGDGWSFEENITLYAKTTPHQYIVTLDPNGGTLTGSNQITATYNENLLTTTTISKEGYIFDGWYDENGVKYIDSNGSGVKVWDKAQDSTLIAHWTIEEVENHTIHFNTLTDIVVESISCATGEEISLPILTRTGYVFEGWIKNPDDDEIVNWTTMPDLTPNEHLNTFIEIYAKWKPITYYVRYNANGGSGTMGQSTFTYDEEKNLEDNKYSKTYYNFKGWAISSDGAVIYIDEQSVINLSEIDKSTIDLYAVWERITYNINYANLTFLGKTADVLLNVGSWNYAPTKYEYGVGLQVSSVSANWQANSASSPHLVFLGWYLDMGFSTPAVDISASKAGDVTWYAKWRYDITNSIRRAQYTIDNSNPVDQTYSDAKYLGLNEQVGNGRNLKEELKSIGIKSLSFNIKLQHWGEGTSYIYLYSETGNQLWGDSFSPGASSSDCGEYTNQVTISLDTLGACSYIYIRYQASSYTVLFWTNSHYWYNNLLYVEIAGVVNAQDFNDPNNKFTWYYNDPFL